MFKTWLCVVIVVVLAAGMVWAEPAVQDNLTFATFDAGALMSTQGWLTYYARSGGWGAFPQDYTYRVVDAGGRRCVVDSYRFAQNHGQGTAIPIDWDGDPANGMTRLNLEPGMSVTVGVALYVMPYSKGWSIDGTGHMIFSLGPGVLDPAGKTFQEDATNKDYDWLKGRGPRFQYRLGDGVDGREILQPELRGLLPESAEAGVEGKTLPTATWYDLRLTVTASADGKTANCTLAGKPDAEAEAWESEGAWSFTINRDSQGADNPERWNALLLDMPLGQWAKKGYGEATAEMMDKIGALSVEVAPAGATGKPQKAQLLQGNRPTINAKVLGPALAFADDQPT